jgi:hypothetical protein
MSEIHKVPASAGAEWLIAGFSLLKRAPLGLGGLGLIWGVVVSVVMSLSLLVPALGTVLQLLVVVAGPLFMGGLLWAVREVDQGRAARPAHLLEGVQDGRAPHLLVTLLPQVVAGLILGALLLLLLGTTGLHQLGEVMVRMNEISQSGQQPDPAVIEALVAELPAGRILLWLLLCVVTLAAISLAMFVMPPQVMFQRMGGWRALRHSLNACLHNLPAMLVFLVLAVIAMMAIYFAVMLVAMVFTLVGGQVAGMWIAQLLMTAVTMPVFAGAVYTAWKQMVGPAAAAVPGGDTPRDGVIAA